MIYSFLKPYLFKLEPQTAHQLIFDLLGPFEYIPLLNSALSFIYKSPKLEVKKCGLTFPNPLGLAAGFDKNALRIKSLAALGFGHIEVGTATSIAQFSNPSPNLFRLEESQSIINRLGFPNNGISSISDRVKSKKKSIKIPVGISIGRWRWANSNIDDTIHDYLISYKEALKAADYIVINISSPNTKDLRTMQTASLAKELFQALRFENDTIPLLVKISPDLTMDAIYDLCDVALDTGLNGIICSNTTVSRKNLSIHSTEKINDIGHGGLSGPSLFNKNLYIISKLRLRYGKEPLLIGVGGIDSPIRAQAMLSAGADLIQIYTSLIYHGPALIKEILKNVKLGI